MIRRTLATLTTLLCRGVGRALERRLTRFARLTDDGEGER
jgi:hypothetical protein